MILSLLIWEEGDNISIDRYISSVIYTDMRNKRFRNKKDGASEAEVA